MRRFRATKIVATLGPVSSDTASIEALFNAGADVFRVNFSHGTREEQAKRIRAIRSVERKTGRPIAILGDLQGPKLRIGAMPKDGAPLEPGAHLRLDLSSEPGNGKRAPLPHPEIFRALEGERARRKGNIDLLLDDGRIRLHVTRCGPDFCDTEVVVGGVLASNKGVNLPNVLLPISALTRKDRTDLDFALDNAVDWIGLSFVQRAEDVAEARRLVRDRAGVLAKIEKPAAIEHLTEILDYAQAVMVARGDLGVECPPESVPPMQKEIVRRARAAGRPVVVATQMLESMVNAPVPTRAEASDVATAVYDGADAVMLSAETAVGKYAIEAVSIMDRIIKSVESDRSYRAIMDAIHAKPEETLADAITAAARQVGETLHVAAIVTYTTSGTTALRAARERPTSPILCLATKRETARKLVLAWGVHPVVARDAEGFDDMVKKACDWAVHEAFAKKGDRLAITAGIPFGTAGATNVLHIALVH